MATTAFPVWAVIMGVIQLFIGIILGFIAYWGKRIDQKIDGFDEKLKDYQTVEKCGMYHLSHQKEHDMEEVMCRDDMNRVVKDIDHVGAKYDRMDNRLIAVEKA